MSFAVTAVVPLGYQWENIDASLAQALHDVMRISPNRQLSDHYAWLLQITSWSYAMDWNPKEGTVTLELPFSGPLTTLDTSHDKADYDRSIALDEISILLQKCMEKVPLPRLLAHIHQKDK